MLQTAVHATADSATRLYQRAPSLVLKCSWEHRLPTLEGDGVELRELGTRDARALHRSIGSPDVARYISPPPPTIAEWERFIAWTHRARAEGRHACFGVVPREVGSPVGLFQIWRLGTRFDTAEWGFVLDRPFWGTGIFERAAELIADFGFDTLGAGRIEARASIENGRGNGALRKLGAHQEALLRHCFELQGQRVHHVLWALLADEWREGRE